MHHIINNDIFYRPDDGAMWLKDKPEEKIILTPTINRLLKLLIEEQGKVITREDIFQRVWDDWGLSGSNNSLNHFISQLRKIFHNYGMNEDAITTVPRIGFMLNTTIIIETIEDVSEDNHFRRFTFTFYKLLFVISLTVFLGSTAVKFTLPHYADVMITPTQTGKIDQCNVYALADYQDTQPAKLLGNVASFMNTKKFSCNSESVIYFFMDKRVLFNETGKLFVAACRGNPQNMYSCINMMDRNWKGV